MPSDGGVAGVFWALPQVKQNSLPFAHKEMLCKVVIYLHMDDAVAAEQALGFASEAVDGWFMSGECQAGMKLVEAFKESVSRQLRTLPPLATPHTHTHRHTHTHTHTRGRVQSNTCARQVLHLSGTRGSHHSVVGTLFAPLGPTEAVVVKDYDSEAVKKLVKDQVFTFLPVEIARIAISLKVVEA
eukprot:6381885-Amphidinium_carterae.1